MSKRTHKRHRRYYFMVSTDIPLEYTRKEIADHLKRAIRGWDRFCTTYEVDDGLVQAVSTASVKPYRLPEKSKCSN